MKKLDEDERRMSTKKEGVPFNLNQLNADNLEELIEHLDDVTVDIDEDKTKVRFFCE